MELLNNPVHSRARHKACFTGDEVGQTRNTIVSPDAIEEEIPKRDLRFLAGLFQADEGVATSLAVFRAGAAAEALASFKGTLVAWTKLQTPTADRLVRYNEASFGEQIFHVAGAGKPI